jgi:hypothetical protein
MQKVLNGLAILLSIAALPAADKEGRFAAKPADRYPNHVTQEKVTLAAVPFVEEADVKAAFGKVDPNKYGVLPVLLVIQNDTGKTLRLNLQTEYVDPDGHHIESVDAQDVQYFGVKSKRKDTNIGIQSPIPFPRRKSSGGPLNTWEITGRAFSARMIPPGEQVSGFVYFQTKMQPGAKFYLIGLSEANTGKELFYFELPLDKK